MAIKTAAEHKADIRKKQVKDAGERYRDKMAEARIKRLETLRDDTLSHLKNAYAGQSFDSMAETVRANGGVNPKTLRKWEAKETVYVQTRSIDACLAPIGKRLGIVDL